MKATLSWLKEFVDVDMEPATLADLLTNAGLECSANREGALEGVVVGELLDVLPHPQSAHLSVCKVLAGTETFPVVCGAPNTRPGIKAPMALAGTSLPGGRRIEAAEIRGERSVGMLCSEAELDVGDDASKLWILPEDLSPGTRVDEVMGLKDWVFEFDLTPNRGDCLSILGIAIEVSAITGLEVRYPDISLDERGAPLSDRFSVDIQDPDLCPRYVARLVEAATVGPSPLWMRRRLQLVGVRPINNLVDVTNYVMWELGQPLHAFDMSRLEGGRIVVKRALPGDTFVSLDGQLRGLTGDMLMIWDGVKPVAVAGVMGGENSEVGDNTRDVLIESACFDPANIRRTARTLGMATEASRRFERGVDQEGCLIAADRAAQLMARAAGCSVAPGAIDAHPRPRTPRPIALRVRRVNELLGTSVEAQEIRSIMERLHLRVDGGGDAGTLMVTPPLRRPDLTREVDLIEEVARIWGYARIPATLPRTSTVAGVEGVGQRAESLCREILAGFGFDELITYTFMDKRALDRLRLEQGDPLRNALSLQNPVRQDQALMRTTLLPGMLDVARRNVSRKNLSFRFFELGKVFVPDASRELPDERRHLGLIMTGDRAPEHWSGRSAPLDLFDLKGVVEELFEGLQIATVRFDARQGPPFLASGQSARIVAEQQDIGWIGAVHPDVAATWDMDGGLFAGEVDFEWMVRLGSLERSYSPLPRFPEVVRDLSIVVDRGIAAGEILEALRRFHDGLEWFEDARVFDLFEGGKRIPRGKKSLTFRIRYRSRERNLRDEEVNEQQELLIRELERRFGARLRE